MPVYPIISGNADGYPHSDDSTQYYVASGLGEGGFVSPEAVAQIRARDSYTWANMAVRVITNTLTNDITPKSRVGGADGNMSVSIGAGLTGLFRDIVNSDALVSGSLFNYQIIVPAGGTSVIITAFASTLTTVANTTPIIVSSFPASNVIYSDGVTYYLPIVGELRASTTEAYVQYTCRVTSTLSKLHSYVRANTLTTVATIRPRIDGADINSVISVPIATTGLFEDAVNTDAIAIADKICHEIDSPAGAGGCYVSFVSFQSDSDGEWIGIGSGSLEVLNDGDIKYAPISASNDLNTTEANTPMPVQANGTARNMMVRISQNSLNDVCVIRLRVNGGDVNLVISVPSATTGVFEDVVNSDALITTDTWNWEVDASAPTIGTTRIHIIGLQFDQPAANTGIEDKSANMGAKMVGAGLL